MIYFCPIHNTKLTHYETKNVDDYMCKIIGCDLIICRDKPNHPGYIDDKYYLYFNDDDADDYIRCDSVEEVAAKFKKILSFL